ncbi:BTAD domain-containing putative transcriptional regulator [Neobacillus niacini]|uniref:BTAD domain-containing putative transcriptional regulator n=1 Tax=Neobacillus niacini TaxID=86668 RepID=UPI0021CB6DCE|nr:BTAD domain-containing putative transcriptional regulator [Neobacillus niacini]MCM3765987.1 transcriptional regulator [Neobacillus niacini]
MKLPIIGTKLRIPTVKDDFIRRAKLTRKMKTIPNYPLTVIHAGAGYGKSTAMALFMNDEKILGCWYSISSMDDDILPFLAHIIHAIRKIVPHFGMELSAYIETIDRYIREEELNYLCSLFINELLDIDFEITLVLDDFHQIEQSYTINSWMEKLLEHIPDNLQIVISSRSRPVWKQLTKMKVTGRLLEITRDDLILTIEEMELLLLDLYGIELEEPQLQTIYQLTEGWIIALCMIAQQIPLKSDISDFFAHSTHSLTEFFQYLVMEVFAKQPPMIQQFLEQTSIFEEIDEELCVEVIGFQAASSLLEQLKERNLFIQKVGQNHYRYHALFKEFLEKQFQTNNPRNYAMLHERCARFYEKRKMLEKALYHYQRLHHTKAMAAILQENGFRMLENGKLESLSDHLAKIADEELGTYYQLWLLKAEVCRYRSQYSEAERFYQLAYDGASKEQDFLGMSKALEGKAKIYLDTIQPQHAERLLYEAISHREKSRTPAEESGKLYELLSENLLNSGKAQKAEKWLEKAKETNHADLDGSLEARLYLRTGRFEMAKKFLYKKKAELEGTKPSNLPQAHREIDLLLSIIEAFTGEGNKAKELAQAGIQLGISLKAPFVEACGWIRMGHAVQILNKYDAALAENCYQTALELMGNLNVSRGKAEPLMGLCVLYGVRGEYERAITAGRLALLETEKVHDVWLSAMIMLGMGIASVYNDRLSKALNYLDQAGMLFRECEDSYGQMLSAFWLAHCFYLEKKQSEMLRYADSFLSLIQLHDYEFFFHKRSVFGPRDLQVFVPLLLQCLKEGSQKAYGAKILQDMGITALESHPGYSIRVQTLGQFKIWLGDKEFGERDWQREKAKELFQLLITTGELIAKEEILSILWPNQEKKSADRDFKVALNSLHHVLEPERKARGAPFFIIRDGSFYGLNPLAVIEVDTEQFQTWVQNGLDESDQNKAENYLEKGLSFYQGDYLPERRYDDWCISKRESMLVYFLRGAEKMAQISVRNENYDRAIFWCEKILERDRTWEEAYRLLMYCYYRKNNRPQALKWYKKCTDVLEEELGVTPLEPTKHMYEMIIQSDSYIKPL